MMKTFGILTMALGLLLAAGLQAQTTATAPATTTAAATATTSAPAMPACCGDMCKKMGACCKTDAAGKTTCPMGGSCCSK